MFAVGWGIIMRKVLDTTPGSGWAKAARESRSYMQDLVYFREFMLLLPYHIYR